MSAAPYAHQWQTKPRILGLNSKPVVIRYLLLIKHLGVNYSVLAIGLVGPESIFTINGIKNYEAGYHLILMTINI
jgi:hypothetical protein